MQVRLGQGAIGQGNYNSMTIFDPSAPLQAAMLSGAVTERLFDGSFNDNQLDPIDAGSGFLTRSDQVYEDTAFALPINWRPIFFEENNGTVLLTGRKLCH